MRDTALTIKEQVQSENVSRSARRCKRLASAAWIGVAVVGLLVGLEVLLNPWVYQRVTRGGETAVPPSLWLAIDVLFPVWLLTPYLACIVLAVAGWSTWRVALVRDRIFESKTAFGFVITGAALSSIGAVVLAVLFLPQMFVYWTRPWVCKTTTFQSAVSPNGRYVAEVVEVDCGAMSGFNRQVLLTRRPFGWAQSSLLYFNDDPALHLTWSGRTLTISGDRTSASMKNPPPELMFWGGMLARYSGPKER